jgi:thiol-disulfide isomerase/thioredoxin
VPFKAAAELAAKSAEPLAATKSTVVVLRTPLPLPVTFNRALGGVRSGRARLVQVWSRNCPDCFEELDQSAQSAATWAATGLDFSALCVDEPAHHAEAQELLRAALGSSASARELPSVFASAQLAELLDLLVEHIVARPGARALPFSLLVDSTGTAQVLYLGPIPRERVLGDAKSYGLQPHDPRSRGAWPGTWLFGQTRDLAGFSRRLRERGLAAEADFYRDVLRMGVGR